MQSRKRLDFAWVLQQPANSMTFRFGSRGSRLHGKTGTHSSLLCLAAPSAIARTLMTRSMQDGRQQGNGSMAARFHGKRGQSTMPRRRIVVGLIVWIGPQQCSDCCRSLLEGLLTLTGIKRSLDPAIAASLTVGSKSHCSRCAPRRRLRPRATAASPHKQTVPTHRDIRIP